MTPVSTRPQAHKRGSAWSSDLPRISNRALRLYLEGGDSISLLSTGSPAVAERGEELAQIKVAKPHGKVWGRGAG